MSSHQPAQTEPCLVSNTLNLPCKASHAVYVHHESDLEAISEVAQGFDAIHFVGLGSNLVVPAVLEGLTVLVRNRGICLAGETQHHRYVDVAAGEVWHEWVTHALQQGWHGLENLALIPGTVGAAPVQNIGAYGVEVSTFIESVMAWDFSRGCLVTLSRDECEFGYRDSVFKHMAGQRLLIVSVRFALPLRWQPVLDYPDLKALAQRSTAGAQAVTPQMLFDAVVHIRRNKLPDPAVIPNAGSFFKNPVVSSAEHERLRRQYPDLVAYPLTQGVVKLAAGWLIDRCGWKGRRLGSVQIHERQALVLTNIANATATEVLNVAALIQQDVHARFGVELEMEPACWV